MWRWATSDGVLCHETRYMLMLLAHHLYCIGHIECFQSECCLSVQYKVITVHMVYLDFGSSLLGMLNVMYLDRLANARKNRSNQWRFLCKWCFPTRLSLFRGFQSGYAFLLVAVSTLLEIGGIYMSNKSNFIKVRWRITKLWADLVREKGEFLYFGSFL